jgi:flagellar biosynthesis chaperone FliJ
MRYPLDPYLAQITEQKEMARSDLLAAQERLLDEKLAGERMSERIDAMEGNRSFWDADYHDRLRAGLLSPADIRSRRHHLDRLSDDLRDRRLELHAQIRVIARCEQALEQAQRKYRDVAAEVEAHEKKKERWIEEIRFQARRKEQKSIEEISAAMIGRAREEGGGFA